MGVDWQKASLIRQMRCVEAHVLLPVAHSYSDAEELQRDRSEMRAYQDGLPRERTSDVASDAGGRSPLLHTSRPCPVRTPVVACSRQPSSLLSLLGRSSEVQPPPYGFESRPHNFPVLARLAHEPLGHSPAALPSRYATLLHWLLPLGTGHSRTLLLPLAAPKLGLYSAASCPEPSA